MMMTAAGVNIILINRSRVKYSVRSPAQPGQWNVVTTDTKFFAECLDDNSAQTLTGTQPTLNTMDYILSFWLLKSPVLHFKPLGSVVHIFPISDFNELSRLFYKTIYSKLLVS